MRTITFYGGIFILFAAGAYLYLMKDNSKPYQIPFINQQAMGLNLGIFNLSVDELTPSTLEAKLIGEWEFQTVMKYADHIIELKGEIIYKEDNTFHRYMTMRYYAGTPGRVKPEDNYLKLVSGGSATGEWQVSSDGQSWVETPQNCTSSNSFAKSGYNLLSACIWFNENSEYQYGTFKGEKSTSEITTVSSSQITIARQDFTTDNIIEYHFSRK